MSSTRLERARDVSILTLARGKVNALDEPMVDRLREQLRSLESDPETHAVVVAGQGSFFSFGFDVPALYDYPPEDFTRFLGKFTDLYRSLFVFPKPVVAAVNGHAVAGGCMLATTADYRIMATGKARISLNEITFGAALFAGSVEMLVRLVGQRHAERVALAGAMYSAEEARAFGLVDEVVQPAAVAPRAVEVAAQMAGRDAVAYAAIKHLLRGPVAERIRLAETGSIQRFVEIWYSPSTREQLKKIQIRS
jgi:enoyl-CoA hydratase/carnithine racemase